MFFITRNDNMEKAKKAAIKVRNVSKVNFQNKQLTDVRRRSVDRAKQACKHSRQVLISTVSAEGSLR